MSTIAAYLLDPSAATIRPVQIEPATIFDTARFFVGADYLALHQIDKRHTAYVDDDGLTKPVTGMFTVAGREGTPVAGRALILGNDSTGDAARSPFLTIEAVARILMVHRPIIIPRLVSMEETHPGLKILSTRVGTLTLDLQRVHPAICKD
ncbi:hypothetical protein [Methylocystis iwaonis]|uniref:Uncharacterized protein n=1 Tax=Methylocystis iwaonis TaxID=2885079 RepID=A0ABN6VKR2_9HYPH|nr:hypothetical protein [Methylocystis iwaonis]BDV36354.1 hypothetical protein SS37A_38840 [Methylocystis iwaonis]